MVRAHLIQPETPLKCLHFGGVVLWRLFLVFVYGAWYNKQNHNEEMRMQDGKKLYTTREEAEELLKKTMEGAESSKNNAKTEKPSAKRGRLIRRILYALVILVMLAMLGKVWIQKLNHEVPSLFGYQLYVVETGSMIPTLPIGANILVRQLRDGDELKVGDIVTYTHNTSAVTHRIVQLLEGDDGTIQYRTKGDNPENSLDPWIITRDDIRGIVIWNFSLSRLFGN